VESLLHPGSARPARNAEWYRSGAIINRLHRLCNTALNVSVARQLCRSSLSPTMSTPPPLNPAPPASSSARKQGTMFRVFKSPEAKSDWLTSSLTTAKMVAAAECIPSPYVKGAFGIVVVILETVDVWSLINSGNLTHPRPTESEEEPG
jgi:hypothetical protein